MDDTRNTFITLHQTRDLFDKLWKNDDSPGVLKVMQNRSQTGFVTIKTNNGQPSSGVPVKSAEEQFEDLWGNPK